MILHFCIYTSNMTYCLFNSSVVVGMGFVVYNNYYYMAESVFAMRLVNFRSVTCYYTDQNFKDHAHFGALNLFTSE